MGWERKRGKLQELNQLLRGHADTTFIDTGARPPADIRFVVTLDADTRLPTGSVAQLVGKIHHPVNRPHNDPDTGVVTRGHAILQPRITASLTSGAESSIFQRVFSVNRGLDPYVSASSDLYQDLLDEGSFTGKGIYAVDAFETALRDRIPENTVLSHDLLEGSLARAALVSDVQFIEDFPTRYEVDQSRQHRWARGDWQLLPFIFDPANGLSPLARYKMLDNLRRTLVPIGWLMGSVLGWLALPADEALRWQVALFVTLIMVPVLHFQAGILPAQAGASRLRQARMVLGDGWAMAQETGLRIAFLAHYAVRSGDAIIRTICRMTISRRHLLEWRTAQQVSVDARTNAREYLRYMAVSPIIGVAVILLTLLLRPENLALALAFGLLWIAAPVIAWAVSRSLETSDRLVIEKEDAAYLRQCGRVTWRYFETFVNTANSHLPPDNFQEEPERLATRTSPTNIGLYLLSVVSARDMGWIGFWNALSRIEATLATLQRLEKYRGHLYNWYDTTDLRVLEPRYISAVDSGNLAGHLVALSSTLRQWAANPPVHVLGTLEGVADVLAVLRARLLALPDDRRALRPLRRRLEERIEGFSRSLGGYLEEPQLAPVRAINLSVIAGDIRLLAGELAAELGNDAVGEVVWWANALKSTCDAVAGESFSEGTEKQALSERLSRASEDARALAFGMDYSFLMDPEKRLLSIGYRPELGERDLSCYDLLASEARLASFFAIAKGDLPIEHWVQLGRPVTTIRGAGTLMSWSGSMFEYLMPPLVMQERTGGILSQSNALAVATQIAQGRLKRVPWGVSESAFNARDHDLNYQYYAFGVQALGLKRSISEDVVIAPYASFLATQIDPAEATRNLRLLERLGASGRYGFYDAVDFTPSRLLEGTKQAVVRNFMAHHHGMTIVAIANALFDGVHRERFHDDPVIKAAELLLQEKAPREIVPITRPSTMLEPRLMEDATQPIAVSTRAGEGVESLALLSNGTFFATLTGRGQGALRTDDQAVTRWRADAVVEESGSFIFLRDAETSEWWSTTAAPRSGADDWTETTFDDHKAEFSKFANGIESRVEVILATSAGAEGRRLTLRNRGEETRLIDVTSYGEIVLDRTDADRTHPAFSKLFVETEIRDGMILARRHPRDPGGQPRFLAHFIAGPSGSVEAETDRRAFIGRGRRLAQAQAFDPGARLSGTAGFTLDACFALRRQISLPPGKDTQVVFWTLIAGSEAELTERAGHFRRLETFEDESRLAWTRSQVQLRHLGITLDDARIYRGFAALVTQPDHSMSQNDEATQGALGSQRSLWPIGLSGDHPLILVRTDDEGDLPQLRKILRMHEYFRLRGLRVDLVVLNERPSSYVEALQDAINALCDASRWHADIQSVFCLRRDMVGEDTLATLLASARMVLHTRNGSLADQLDRNVKTRQRMPVRRPARPNAAPDLPPAKMAQEPLRFWNGIGGFSTDGREYVIRLRHGKHTPTPGSTSLRAKISAFTSLHLGPGSHGP